MATPGPKERHKDKSGQRQHTKTTGQSKKTGADDSKPKEPKAEKGKSVASEQRRHGDGHKKVCMQRDVWFCVCVVCLCVVCVCVCVYVVLCCVVLRLCCVCVVLCCVACCCAVL